MGDEVGVHEAATVGDEVGVHVLWTVGDEVGVHVLGAVGDEVGVAVWMTGVPCTPSLTKSPRCCGWMKSFTHRAIVLLP